MPSEQFWALIGSMRGQATDEAFRDLHASLLAVDPSQIVEFRRELGEAVRALTTPEHLAQTVQDPSEVDIAGSADLPLMGTAAVGAACAVIIEGPDVYADVVAHPELLAGVRPIASAVDLMDVPEEAYQELTGDAYMGGVPRLSKGFIERLGTARMFAMESAEEHGRRIGHLCDTVGVDPRWVSWWRPCGYERMILYIEHRRDAQFRVTVRRPRTDPASVQVDLVLPPRVATLSAAEAVRLADEDFERLLATVGKRLGLSPPPALLP